MDKFFKDHGSTFKDVMILFGFTWITFALCFPEYILFPKVSFFLFNFNQGYAAANITANQFYHGGIQLWDRYDQMSYAYYAITLGIYKIFEILTTLVYACISPFVWDQAKTFHHVYAVVFVSTNLFFKVLGSYLLLKRFISIKSLLYASVIFVSVFLSQQIIKEGIFAPSLYPLGIHLILNVFERRTLKDLWIATSYLVIFTSYSIVHSLYFYCNMHMFLLLALGWSIWNAKGQGQVILANLRREIKAHWPILMGVMVAWILILAPYAYMIKHCLNDFYFNQEASRIHNMWAPDSYLSKVVPLMFEIKEFVWRAVYFSGMHTWPFFGCFVIFFALAGLIFSNDQRKYIFAGNIAFLLTLASVHSGVLGESIHANLFTWLAHWLTIWTNPIKFILRDFQEYMRYVLPFLLTPLAVMGIEAIYVKFKEGLPVRRSLLFLGLIYAYAWMCWLHRQDTDIAYVIAVAFAMTILIIFSLKQHLRPMSIRMIFLWAFLMVDVTCCYMYLRRCFTSGTVLDKTETIIGAPELKTVSLKYNNPQILPFRQYFTNTYFNILQNHYFDTGIQSRPGALFHFTNVTKNFINWDVHQYPRHKIFANLPQDPVSSSMFFPAGPLVYEVGYARKDSNEEFVKLSHQGVAKDVVLISDNPQFEQKELPSTIQPLQAPTYAVKNFKGNLSGAKTYESEGLRIYAIPMPKECPNNMASNFLTPDQYLMDFTAQVGSSPQVFMPVQGQIVQALTYDVNNIRKGWIVAGFPKDQTPGPYSFSCAQAVTGITDVWKNEEDNLGFNYQATINGWLVMIYPYDAKWKIIVDGKPIQLYKANRAFITFPISQGPHKILMQYWPETPLRGLLLISIILSTVGLIGIMYVAMAEPQGRDQS